MNHHQISKNLLDGSPMKLKASDEAVRGSYEAAKPKQFGSLHERMKWLMEKAHKVGHEQIGEELWHAIHDLQTEVKYHVPAKPPFGRRVVGKSMSGEGG